MYGVLAICIGASIGALSRWKLSLWLNRYDTFPLGTFVSNIIGAYIIGFVSAWLLANPKITMEWRLFIVTGFLGSLTTFSTFSYETVTNLAQGRLLWALALVLSHVLASIVMCYLGMQSFQLIR